MRSEERGGNGPGGDGGGEEIGGQKPQVPRRSSGQEGPALHKIGDAAQAGPGAGGAEGGDDLGPNNERLHELQPRVVAALRDLMLEFRAEGLVARRHEIRRIKQARLFWQGLQYAWWNPNDMSWHLPFEFADDG